MIKVKLSSYGVKEGDSFEEWNVLGPAFSRGMNEKSGLITWAVVAKCSCGEVHVVNPKSFVQGNSSCFTCAKRTHGESGIFLYGVWQGMHDRCYNVNGKDYHNYGERGIAVCEAWHKYESFRDWAISHGYEKGLILDRRENDLGYSPDNCRFVTAEVSNRNKRNVNPKLREGSCV